MTAAWAFAALILTNYGGEYKWFQSTAYEERSACEAAAKQAPLTWIVVKAHDGGACALVPICRRE